MASTGHRSATLVEDSLQTVTEKVAEKLCKRGEQAVRTHGMSLHHKDSVVPVAHQTRQIVAFGMNQPEDIGQFRIGNLTIWIQVVEKTEALTVSDSRGETLTKEIEYKELEIELDQKRIREGNEAINSRAEEIEKSQKEVEERSEDLEAKKAELESIVAETKQQEEKLRERGKELELAIEPRLLTAFKRIRKNSRNGLGIVTVQRDACGGCFNKIPPQKQMDIRMRKKIIVCEYCGRIMIDPELAGFAKEEPKAAKKRTRAKKTEE